jgi:hypothetical protein
MSTIRKRLTVALLVSTALLVAPAMSGCSALEGIIEQVTGGDVNVSVGSLPDGWPTEVPVIDGDILGGATTKADDGTPIWNVTIKGDSNSADDVATQLEDAGFEAVDLPGEVGSGDLAQAFKNDTYGVLVAVTGADDNWVVNYTVAEGDPVNAP